MTATEDCQAYARAQVADYERLQVENVELRAENVRLRDVVRAERAALARARRDTSRSAAARSDGSSSDASPAAAGV